LGSGRRGVFVLILLLTVLGTAVLFAAFRLRRPSEQAGSGLVLVWKLPFVLEEGEVPFRGFGIPWATSREPYLHEVISGIDRAAHDPRVSALVLRVDYMQWGWAKATEVREAVQRFRSAGKPVFASLTGGGEIEYYVASSANVVAVPPEGRLWLDGLTATAMFFHGALDKLDVQPNFVQAGTYKSAVEQYTRSSMSEASRAAMDAVLDDLFQNVVDSLASSRGLPPEEIVRLLDTGPFTATQARDAGLADTLLYDADVDSFAVEVVEGAESPLDFDDYLDRTPRPRGPIALIHASGTILPGRSGEAPGEERVLGSETMIEALREARERDGIRAAVLRIDSPGGSIQASDDIWIEVKRLSEAKPLIVSMSDVAASGGYYIAAPASRIVAQPSTITGSIGVYGGKFNVRGLLDKLGIQVETLSRGAHAGVLSPFRDFTPEELERFQQQTDASYRVFLGRVSEGRGLELADVDSIAQGRVWTGIAAWQRGLVDTLGGLSTAIALAREAAGLPDDAGVEVIPRVERTWIESLIESAFEERDSRTEFGTNRMLAALPAGPALRAWIVASRLQGGVILALMPWTLEVR